METRKKLKISFALPESTTETRNHWFQIQGQILQPWSSTFQYLLHNKLTWLTPAATDVSTAIQPALTNPVTRFIFQKDTTFQGYITSPLKGFYSDTEVTHTQQHTSGQKYLSLLHLKITRCPLPLLANVCHCELTFPRIQPHKRVFETTESNVGDNPSKSMLWRNLTLTIKKLDS